MRTQWLQTSWQRFQTSPFGRLTAHFLHKMVSGGHDASSSDLELGAAALLGILAAPGAFTSLLMLDKYSAFLNWMRGRLHDDLYVTSVPDKYLFLCVAMAVTGIVTVLKWDQILPDQQDYLNLAPTGCAPLRRGAGRRPFAPTYDLADPDAAKRASELWLQQLSKTRGNDSVRRQAVDALQFCSPEQAERLLLESKDRRALANLYAYAALGMTGWTYDSHEPAGSDPARRQSDFAQNARKELEDARDPDFVLAATNAVMRQGAILWADGKLDWDYTELGSRLLARARSLSPEELSLFTIPTALPKRGERPPATLRIGGNVQQAKLVRQTPPRYPTEARAARITGTVELAALIGLDGAILHLRPLSGPRELIPASLEAVRDWVYQPTLLNGKPCYVETRIDVNYTISRQ